MDEFYIFKSGTIKRKNGSVVLKTDEEELLIPIEQVHSIYVFVEVTLNKRVLELLNKYQIFVLFFNYYGNLIGSFNPVSKRPVGRILINQVNAFQQEQIRVYIAKTIQQHSIKNCLALLKYYQKKGEEIQTQIELLRVTLMNIEYASSVEEILLLEARAKKEYYSAFDIILRRTPYTFERRSIKPPRNQVNAVMSFGYSVLYGLILAELHRSRLYPEVPFIHSENRPGYGLQYDLADIYKPIYIDRLVLGMLRRERFEEQDFEVSEDGGVYLSAEGKKKFLYEFDERLQKTVQYGTQRKSYRSIIRGDLHRLISFLDNTEGELRFYLNVW